MKCSKYVLLFTVTVILMGTFYRTSNAWARTWTDRKGRTVEADFLELAGDKVRIKRNSDGKIFEFALAVLSDEDQEFVRGQVKKTKLQLRKEEEQVHERNAQQRLEECRVVAELMARKQDDLTSEEQQMFAERLVELADLYREANARQQAEIRAWFKIADCWPLVSRIRGYAQNMHSKEDIVWLRRGLALAAIEDNRTDYRDLIVSLVILRYGAERVDIETAPEFDAVMKISTERVHGVLKNARDHAAKDIKATLKAFGPRQWANEIP